MVFHHHLGTIHPKQLVLVWWSVAKLWCEYGISPYFWHYSSKTACIGMMVSHQAMTWIWYFTIILAPFIQNSLGYYKLEYNANVSEAEESNRLQANFPLHSVGSPEPCSALLFAKPLTDHCKAEIFVLCRQAGTIQQLVLAWLSVARLWHEYTKQVVNINHPTACIGMLVMNPPTAHVHKLVILCQPDQTHQQLACICLAIFAAYIWNCYSWTMQKPFDIAHSCTLLW